MFTVIASFFLFLMQNHLLPLKIKQFFLKVTFALMLSLRRHIFPLQTRIFFWCWKNLLTHLMHQRLKMRSRNLQLFKLGVFVTALPWNLYFSDRFTMKGIFQKTIKKMFQSLTPIREKHLRIQSNVLILHYPLIKWNALHKITIHLVVVFFGKHFSVHNVEWQQRNEFRKVGSFLQKKRRFLQLVVEIIEKWLWRALSFSLIWRLQARSVTKKIFHMYFSRIWIKLCPATLLNTLLKNTYL